MKSDKTPRPSRPFGGATVEERAEIMASRLSAEDKARRNSIPTTNVVGEPLRILADEYWLENDEATHYRPEHPDDPGPAAKEELKPGVLREAHKITDRLFHKTTADDPDYWGLASVMTEEEAEFCKHMKVRVPETLEQICAATQKSEAEALAFLDELSLKGILEYNWENLDGKNPEHKKRWLLPMFVPGSAEFTVMNQRQMKDHPEIGTFFERMTYLPLTHATKMVPPGGAGIGMHVIPVEQAIVQENETADVEHLSHWLKKYDRYAAGACSCAVAERARGENCGRDVQNWCIGVGDMADYLVETGKGHYVTFDEVIDILLLAEKNGYVHQITNIDGERKIFAICNCDVNVCYALRTSQLFNTPNMSASAYRAEVDERKCVACAGCVEVCPAGAVQLGQKLPTKAGKKNYPKQALPDALKWDESRWDPNYKNNNRIETHESGTAPCKSACPAHIAVQGYIRMAAEGRFKEALALIKKENPFPAVCGRVCNKRCEAACTRGTVDEALAIDDIKNFIAQKDLDADERWVPEKVMPTTRGGFSEKIAIIGGGPAGLTCAYYLAEMGYEPEVFEKNELAGGMMHYGIPSYKLQKDVVAAEIEILKLMGVKIHCGIELGKDITIQQLREQGFCAFYLAIGCQGGRLPGIVGEDAKNVFVAVDFLRERLGRPDEHISGTTVVVGGGNVAIDAARVAKRSGSEQVFMYSLEQPHEMAALPEEILEAKEDGIQLEHGWGPKEIEQDEQGRVTAIIFKRCTSVFDENGRFSPQYDESECCRVATDRVIFSIGQKVDWADLLAAEDVELKPNGLIVTDPQTYQSSVSDIFAGGDVQSGPRFIIDAIAAGHEAAVSLHRFAQKGSSLTLARNQRVYHELDTSDIYLDEKSYDHSGRNIPGCAKIDVRVRPWDDPRKVFTPDELAREARRCLSCGASIVDQNKCIGCGLCTTRCEFDAIHLKRIFPEASKMTPAEEKVKHILPYAAKRAVKIVMNRDK